MSHNGFPPDPPDMTLPASINVSYQQENDDEILRYTSPDSYWWRTPATVGDYRVTAEAIQNQFADFFNAVVNGVIDKSSTIHCYFDAARIDVPGLAERPPNLTPNVPIPLGAPNCSRCVNYDKLREVIVITHMEILQIDRRLDEAVRIGVEAADRSVARVGVYDVLGALSQESASGYPFHHGEELPPWFRNKHPKHDEEEPSRSDQGTSPQVHDEGSGDLDGRTSADEQEVGASQSETATAPHEPVSPSSPGTSIPDGFNPGSTDAEDDSAEYSEASAATHSGTSDEHDDSDESGNGSDSLDYIDSDHDVLGEEVESE